MGTPPARILALNRVRTLTSQKSDGEDTIRVTSGLVAFQKRSRRLAFCSSTYLSTSRPDSASIDTRWDMCGEQQSVGGNHATHLFLQNGLALGWIPCSKLVRPATGTNTRDDQDVEAWGRTLAPRRYVFNCHSTSRQLSRISPPFLFCLRVSAWGLSRLLSG